MAFSKKYSFIFCFIIALPLCFGIAQTEALTTDYCDAGLAEPPFLAYGVDPNLLLLIDNSGSTLDLGYVDTDKECFDGGYSYVGQGNTTVTVADTYNSGTTYAGYFEKDVWYAYDFSAEKFVNFDDLSAAEKNTVFDSVTFDEYYYNANPLYAYIKLDTANSSVTGFKAKGNFLNWTTASKIDIQKEILTGGKYDATNSLFIMESRGCSGRRFVKQISLDTTDHSGAGATAETNYLTLAVKQPEQPTYDAWTANTFYAEDSIVSDSGYLYIAGSDLTSGATSLSSDINDDNKDWHQYSPWALDTDYPAGSIVSDASKANTLDKGTLYYTADGGVSTGDGVDTDDVDWVPYHLTHIEIFPVTTSGFNHGSCQDAITEMAKCCDGDETTDVNQGQLGQDIDDCMGYQQGGGSSDTANSHAAFNHALHNCWYHAKHTVDENDPQWPNGQGSVTSMKTACQNVYGGTDPWNITTDDRGYICYGSYSTDPKLGYVGRCWEPPGDPDAEPDYQRVACNPATDPTSGEDPFCNTSAGNIWYTCDGSYNVQQDRCGGNPGEWVPMLVDINAGSLNAWGWTDDDVAAGTEAANDQGDACVQQAMRDYCGQIQVPEVIDPSDQVSVTGEIWNVPAVLVDSGVVAQLDSDAWAVLKGQIDQPSAPTGLIHNYTNDIRMGAMVFNDNGATSASGECTDDDDNILYQCAGSLDGGRIISDIAKSDSHTTDLVNAINDIKATSWTPLAEALYNAVGYYAQNSNYRLSNDDNDFKIGASYDPITYYCQKNNILIITEGSSTMDLHASVNDSNAFSDGDTDAGVDCGDLSGSTYLDDLTYFANSSDSFNTITAQLDGHNKESINTHIVVAGTPRDTGTGECRPDVLLGAAATNGGTSLYTATDPNQLKAKLEDAFESIRAGAAAGSAASVISASRGGEGATYQAIFWPRVDESNERTVDWIGEVHALFVDSQGNLYEDDGDRILEPGTDGDDDKVSFYFNEDAGGSKACNGTVTAESTCDGTSKDLEEVKYLWSAAEWLANIPPATVPDDPTTDSPVGAENILSNRTTYISSDKNRFIFTWNDLNNDGVVDSTNGTIGTGELLHFVDSTRGTDWSTLSYDNTSRGSVLLDFGAQGLTEANEIVNWVRGMDDPGLRRRDREGYDFKDGQGARNLYWRLGDVVHSTPISVSGPAEGFQFLYGDSSYREFVEKWKDRRHMVYFGANDGMIHAVNGGFYDELNTRFCRTSDCTDEGTVPTSSPELGAELWAYVPYNLFPHLKCLKDPNYEHKYFVDLHPRIFDVRIFNDDTDHPDGWGTILVQGMRLGGAKVRPGELDLNNDGTADAVAEDNVTDTREFTSAYVVLDITNPEIPPKLLGEFTRTTDAGDNHVDLAYTTITPTLVVMTEDAANNNTSWYLILGSGPTEVDGTSTQDAKLAVIPLSDLVSTNKFQIADTNPTAGTESGTFTLSSDSFVTDIISVDFELEEDYKTDVVYFGTVSGTWGSWGGGMYRLVTRQVDTNGDQTVTLPSQWGGLLNNTVISLSNPDGLAQNNPDYLINVGQPITGAASIGFDGDNYWVYFGTGRFFDEDDKADASSNAQQTFYGIKEPRDCRGYTRCDDCLNNGKGFTWQTVEKTGIWDSIPGEQGLLQVDMIQVGYGNIAAESDLTCLDNDADCETFLNTTGISKFDSFELYIAGTGTCFDSTDDSGELDLYSTGTDGWYKDFHDDRERNLGQATLLGGLLTFTTYQPFEDECLPEGLGFLYGVYFRTGTAWYQSVFDADVEVDPVPDRLDLGRGLAITPNLHVGKQEGSKAFVQTSTGTIVEIPEPNLPLKAVGTGRTSWGEIK